MRLLTALLGSTMLIAAAGAAHAQTTGVQPEGPVATPEETAVDDIVVTANRREERLQDVPVTVSLVSGEQLERQNINTVENLTRSVPQLQLAGPAGFGAISIRGVGGLSFSRSSEGSVGVVVDGVALANQSGNPPLLFDIQRIEVLEGPQGMLFGRNASAGVINIVTNAPNPAAFEAIGHVDIGSRENYVARGTINIPVADNAALRVSGSYAQEPRIAQNLFDGSWRQPENIGGRARFLWEATDTLTINLGADYSRLESEGGVPWSVFSSTPGSPLSSRLAACGVTVSEDNTEGCINEVAYNEVETWGASAQADLALNELTLTSITAVRSADGASGGDIDSAPVTRGRQDITDELENFSQELRLTSPSGGPIEYVAGLYYFRSETSNVSSNFGPILADLDLIGACPFPFPGFCQLPLGGSRQTDTETESMAIFGQATLAATDRLRFIVGARLGREEVGADATGTATAPGAIAPIADVPAVAASVEDDYFSYRLGIQYDVTDDLMAFATFAEGYKGPAVNDQAPSPSTPLIVEAETPRSFEVGFKATIFGGRAALNATAFHTQVDNFQAQFIDTSGPTPVFVFGNAESFTVNGVSAQLLGRPIDGLLVSVGVAYLSSQFDEEYLQQNASGVIVDVSQLGADNRWRFTSSAEYTWPVFAGFEGFVQGDLVYTPRTFSDQARSDILSIDDGWTVGGRLGVRTEDGRYGVSIYGRNIFDEFRPTARFATPLAAQQLDPASFSQFDGPEAHRVIGVSLDARF